MYALQCLHLDFTKDREIRTKNSCSIFSDKKVCVQLLALFLIQQQQKGRKYQHALFPMSSNNLYAVLVVFFFFV